MAQNWIIDRSLLLMDEPFSALDVHTRLSMETRAAGAVGGGGRREQARQRRPIVFVTHDLEEAIALADEVSCSPPVRPRRVVARHPVALERPRDLMELRTVAGVRRSVSRDVGVLREEVVRSQRAAEPTRG